MMRDNARGNNVTAEFSPGWRLADSAVRTPFDFGQHALKMRPNQAGASQFLVVTQFAMARRPRRGDPDRVRRAKWPLPASSCAAEQGAVIAARCPYPIRLPLSLRKWPVCLAAETAYPVQRPGRLARL